MNTSKTESIAISTIKNEIYKSKKYNKNTPNI